MDFISDPLWWLLFMGLILSLSLYGILSLEGTFSAPRTAPSERSIVLKYLSLFSSAVFVIFVLRLFGCIATVTSLLGSAILCLFVLLTRLDWKGHFLAQIKNRIAQQRYHEGIKKRHIGELKEHLKNSASTESLFVTDEDLDDYLELLSCAWPDKEIPAVMKNREVFEYYFTNRHLSKWDILKAVQRLPRKGRPSFEPAKPVKG